MNIKNVQSCSFIQVYSHRTNYFSEDQKNIKYGVFLKQDLDKDNLTRETLCLLFFHH